LDKEDILRVHPRNQQTQVVLVEEAGMVVAEHHILDVAEVVLVILTLPKFQVVLCQTEYNQAMEKH
jgi:hypothetical protein